MSLTSPEFWIALFQIIMINIVLSGDNAVVIALASRSLPPQQQKKAILFGSIGAIVARLALTFFAVMLLAQPYLKLVGAALLLWIGVGLLKGGDEEGDLEAHSGLAAAIKNIMRAPTNPNGRITANVTLASFKNGDTLQSLLQRVLASPMVAAE